MGKKKNSIVSGVSVVRLPIIKELRGNLLVAEYGKYLPFIPKRYFLVFDVPGKEVRGDHAHKKLHQFLTCIKGSCSIVVDDGNNREEILLDTMELGVYLSPMIWSIQYKYSPDAILLVLVSDVYRDDDYIRDYEKFLDAAKKQIYKECLAINKKET